MAEISADATVPATAEDIDFSLDDNLQTADVAGEDFDFDLGDGEGNEGAHLEVEGDGPTAALTKIEIAADVDEIGYEEEGAQGDSEKDTAAEAPADHKNGAPEHGGDADEITYDDNDVQATAHDDSHDAVQTNDGDALEQHEADGGHNDIDFGFEEIGDHTGEEEHEETEHGDYDQEVDSHQNDENQEREEDEEDENDDDEDEDDENEDENKKRAKVDQDDSDGTGQDYDDDDDDDEGDSHSDSLDTGLGRLQSLYPLSTFDVVVTWGEQVCPLFKTPGVEDPDSFYLEDYEAMNYPLSKFLQTVRESISSWVHRSHEIYIRVDDLGLEFGETTTEALLGQVTFHNLLALHNTLIKNDGSGATKGVHITLGTRSNCLLRLKDLVGGASAGKGLSTFQPARSGVDESSDDSAEAEAESDDSSPDGEAEDMIEEDEDGALVSDDDGVDIDMAGSLDDHSAASESFLQAASEEAGELSTRGVELETPTADEDDDAEADAAEEVDFIDYTNEDEDEHVGGVLLGATGVSDLATPQADNGDELEFAGTEGDILQDIATDANNLDHHDDLDLLEDLNDAGDILGQDQEGAHTAPANGFEPADHENNRQGDDDDFLDLNGDINDNATSAETLETGNKASTDDADASLGTSATATLDQDEIDYEDSRPGAKAEATPDAGVDEIDWDDEIKNAAPKDATLTPATASGKRTREVDEPGDALLDDTPDLKRHRTSEPSV